MTENHLGPHVVNIVGMRFGRLVVVSRAENGPLKNNASIESIRRLLSGLEKKMIEVRSAAGGY